MLTLIKFSVDSRSILWATERDHDGAQHYREKILNGSAAADDDDDDIHGNHSRAKDLPSSSCEMKYDSPSHGSTPSGSSTARTRVSNTLRCSGALFCHAVGDVVRLSSALK